MRWLVFGVGLLISLMGLVWILQGLNLLGGSVMSDQIFWAWAGLVALGVGVGVVYASIRRSLKR